MILGKCVPYYLGLGPCISIAWYLGYSNNPQTYVHVYVINVKVTGSESPKT